LPKLVESCLRIRQAIETNNERSKDP
jgi:hypothetical protein